MFPIDLLVISRPEYLLAPTLWSLSTLFFTPVTSRCIFGHWSNYTCDNYTWSVLTSCRPLADFRVLLISPSGAEDVILIISIVYIQHILFLVFWKNVFVLGDGWRGSGLSKCIIISIHNRCIKNIHNLSLCCPSLYLYGLSLQNHYKTIIL